MVFNQAGEVFLAKRGLKAKNERGCWEFPGGSVEYGEPLIEAVTREFYEEYQMEIAVLELLCVTDHILPQEKQHWVSPTYIARYVSGSPQIMEPEKCAAIGWFSLAALPEPLSMITEDNLQQYQARYGLQSRWG